jgi:5-methylcytosine-specific restriction endonuclease McrA
MQKQFNILKEDLFDLFIIKNMTRKEVARHYGCSDALIKLKCRKYLIKKPKYLENKNKERKLEKICPQCKNIFIVTPKRYFGKYEQKCCSYKCMGASRFLGEKHKRKLANDIAARRRANMKSASVPLTKEERKKITDIYLNCPKGYEVDHIIPISKNGKHHPDNLQYLTITENRKKHNK